MSKLFTSIVLLCFFALHTKAQSEQLRIVDFKKLPELFEKEQKALLIFIHTDWCKICKMQENTTFKDSAVVNLLNDQYYTLKLDAESKDSIVFFGRTYHFDPNKGYHELATYLSGSDKQLKFPTTVMLNKGLTPFFRSPALVSAEELRALLNEEIKE